MEEEVVGAYGMEFGNRGDAARDIGPCEVEDIASFVGWNIGGFSNVIPLGICSNNRSVPADGSVHEHH